MEKLIPIGMYRDPDSLPLVIGLDEVKAGRYAILVYSIAAVVFAFIFIAYFQIDALKENVVSITTTILVGQTCESLATVNKQAPFEAMRTALACPAFASTTLNASFPLCTPLFSVGQVDGVTSLAQKSPVIVYDSAFYTTFDACLEAVSTNCTFSRYDTDVNTASPKRFISFSCSFAPRITLSGLQGLRFCGGNDRYCANYPENFYPTSFNDGSAAYDFLANPPRWNATLLYLPPVDASKLTSVVNNVMPPSSVCAPYKENPPYQCTQRVAPSGLTVLANSFAITSTCITLLVAVTTFVASSLHGSTAVIRPTVMPTEWAEIEAKVIELFQRREKVSHGYPLSSVGIDASSSPESKNSPVSGT